MTRASSRLRLNSGPITGTPNSRKFGDVPTRAAIRAVATVPGWVIGLFGEWPKRIFRRPDASVRSGRRKPDVGVRSTMTFQLPLVVFAFVVALAWPSAVLAQDSAAKVRQVFVPASRPDLWPKGDRIEVPFAEYWELREAATRHGQERNAAFIEWQSLTATFDPQSGALTSGQWTAEVRSDGKPARFLSLDPFDAALANLRWSDGNAVWGSSPSEQTLLRVDSSERRLLGDFTLQGRRLRRGWQFALQLAPATVSELELRVPSTLTVKCSAGQTVGPLTSDNSGWRTWRIRLGGQSQCKIVLNEAAPQSSAKSVVVYEQTASYVLRESDVELQYDVTAEVFHAPQAALTFAVPEGVTIYSVEFARDTRLPWQDLPATGGQPRQIKVFLPEPQLGRIRKLQILAGTSSKWDGLVSLPRLVLVDGWFLGGQGSVSVESPLIWRSLAPSGLRMTAMEVNASNVRRLSFVQFLADANLAMDVAYPQPHLSARCLQWLRAVDSEWRLSADWSWQLNSGVVFNTRCRVPAGWAIVDVRPFSDELSQQVRHWDVVTEPSGDRTLVCEFVRPLSSAVAQKIRIEARRPRSLDADREVLEGLGALETRRAEQLLVVTVPSGWRCEAGDDAVSSAAGRTQFAEQWQDLELWKTEADRWAGTTLWVPAAQLTDPLRTSLSFQRDENLLSKAAASVTAPSSDLPLFTSLQPSITPWDSRRENQGDQLGSHSLVTPAPDAITDQLVWTTAELRSLVFPGGAGNDVHWLTLTAAQVTRVGQLEFELPGSVELIAVRMNGVLTDVERQPPRFHLPSIPQGGLHSLEIRYRVPSQRGFLRNRQAIPVPQVTAPVLGFQWQLALPPESRLGEEPAGLRLLQPLDPTPWLRRLFGPLGRDRESTWFNPLSQRSWNDLWAESNPGAARRQTSASFAPPGWAVRDAVAPSLPTQVSWMTWNATQVRLLAWIGMLFSTGVGCLLRYRRIKPRVHIAALWLGLCAVGVVLTQPVEAEILGGCLIGTLIAVLIPRRLVMSYAAARRAEVRGAFETTIAVQRVVGAALLAALLALSDVFAQEPATPSSARASSGERRESGTVTSEESSPPVEVLIPVDDPTRATGELVQPSESLPFAFVPRHLLKQWRQPPAIDVAPETLLSSARYEIERVDEQITLRADFVLHRLAPDRPVRLRFPFADLPLAGTDSCLVDGQPASVEISPRRDVLWINLPPREPAGSDSDQSEVVTQRLSFVLLPPLASDEFGSVLKWSLPRVSQTEVIVKPSSGLSAEIPDRRGEQVVDPKTNRLAAQLGKRSGASVVWHRQGAAPRARPADIHAEVNCWTELLPADVRQRDLVHYTVSAGEVQDISWRLPRGTVLRDIEVTADELLQWSLEALPDGQQRLVIEFTEPQTDEFTIDVTGLQSATGAPDSPRWVPWVAEASLPGRVTPKIRSFLLGVATLPAFQITPPALRPDQAIPLTEGAFLKSWDNVALPRPPQAAWQLMSPAELTFQIAPVTARKQVRQELLLKIGSRSIDWQFFAEVSTQGAPIFQHDLTLAPHFRPDEAAVSEDEAERLLHWTTADQRATLFLRDETAGIQNVVLQGREALPIDGRLVIPTRWFEKSEFSDFALCVTHDPKWQIQVLDDQQQLQKPVVTGGPMPERSDLFLGKFRAGAADSALHVRITPQVPASTIESWTVITQSAATSWTLRHIERLLDEGQITARVRWPAAWAKSGRVRLSASLRELARRAIPDAVEITVQSLPDVETPREILFESQAETAGPTEFRLTTPETLDIRKRFHTWLLADSFRPLFPATVELVPVPDPTALPESVRQHLATSQTAWLQIAPALHEYTFRSPPADRPAIPQALSMDTTVWVADGTIPQGRTSLLLQPQGLSELSWRRPNGIRWRAAFVNESPCDLPEDSDSLTISHFPAEPLLWLTIFWSVDSTPTNRAWTLRETQLPLPLDSACLPPKHQVTLISTGHSEISSTRGARRVAHWDGKLSRAEQFLKALTQSAPASATRSRLTRTVQRDVEDSRELLESLSADVGGGAAAARRLQDIAADLDTARDSLEQIPPTSTTIAAPQWSSDAWWHVPNSWDAVADPTHAARLSILVVDRRWLKWIIAALTVVALVPLFRAWLRWESGEWLAAHPSLAWAGLGLIWWTCLAPSVIGFGLVVVAATIAFRHYFSGHTARHVTLPSQ